MSPELRACAKRYVTEYDAQEEILQRTRLTALAHDGHTSEHPHYAAWLRTVCVRHCLMYLRTRRRAQAREAAAIDAFHFDLYGGKCPGPDVTDLDQTANTLLEDLDRALAALTERQRMVVTLRVMDEYPVATVAQLLGCRESTIRATQHQALAKLRTLLSEIRPG